MNSITINSFFNELEKIAAEDYIRAHLNHYANGANLRAAPVGRVGAKVAPGFARRAASAVGAGFAKHPHLSLAGLGATGLGAGLLAAS